MQAPMVIFVMRKAEYTACTDERGKMSASKRVMTCMSEAAFSKRIRPNGAVGLELYQAADPREYDWLCSSKQG